MSQNRTLSAEKDTTRRIKTDGSTKTGCGLSKHLYVGRYGNYDYDSFIKFTLDWTDVGKIVSAHLNLYTDEYDTFGAASEPGIMNAPVAADRPYAHVKRLTTAFTEGNNVDGDFDASDYTAPGNSTPSKAHTFMPAGANVLHSIDITDMVRSWAPATVEGGGRYTNHGLALYGSIDSTMNWSGWSKKHAGGGGAAERPTISLVYEFGATVPTTPANLTPTGSVASVSDFEGDFADIRTTDKLQSTSIEIYDAGAAATTDSTTDLITASAPHGLLYGDQVYFSTIGTSGLTKFAPYYVISSGLTATAFRIGASPDATQTDITGSSAVTITRLVGSFGEVASESDRVAAHFIVAKPATVSIVAGLTYRWRARYTDNEAQVSAWAQLVSFTLTNTAPVAPTLSPVSASSYASLNLVKFEGGAFSDADGDTLNAYQIQLSPFASGDARWNEADGILWDTGKTLTPYGVTSWVAMYGGSALAAGTYYWRAKHWDSRGGVSAWTYAQIILSASFNPDPASYTSVQTNPQAPWRILIRDLYLADGVTKTTGRAPGRLVAVFEEAKNIGASIVYNSPGELHFTLLKDDPQISVVEPKQVHYAVEFYSGDGWQEKYAGVIWDMDATEVDVVFKGIDYLALYDTVMDERYDPLKPNKSYTAGGSFYSDVTIRAVVLDQLNRAKNLTNSWVGFIAIGTVATMDEKVTVYSTMQPVLAFVGGLIDSHRQGTGKRSRIKVAKLANGTYELQVVDDPGVVRNDLAMYYGELAQGYRVIVFGEGWANVQHIVGRNREGSKVVYQTIENQPFQPSQTIYGRIATVAVIDGVQDQSDLARRGLQAAIQNAKLGKQIAIGIRTEYLQPLQGWDVCDIFPLSIVDGAVDTGNFGSGYWASYAAAWEATDIGQQSLTITFLPREDTTAPDPDLIPSYEVSTQPEWQIGWAPPDPLGNITSKYWYDISTGIIYIRNGDGTYTQVSNDPRTNNLIVNSGFEVNAIATTLTKVWDVTAEWGTIDTATDHNISTGTDTLTMTDGTYA